ncbi:hypothetical protein Aspvir_001751 [Aspergillus viridinutans]|uniref:GPI anchored protein n=1 Tax=Aspergillus viridinutans TaxID=75553 RepID=A0A9P3C4M3_ASPVI|nr:uncharacterized protein Aspvir_001751 [Aspergillus viridinutans]GIK06108.1 hypothetical protein Aspvir_001751 [Aspergillus viridinutans]
MQFKALATLLFAALAVANPAPQDGGDLTDLLGSIPSSVLAELMTAIPPSVIAAFANPTSAASIVNEIEQGHIPAWYTSLPDDVKAWASSAAMKEIAGLSATPTPTGSSAATATGYTTTAAVTSSSTKTTTSSSAGASSTSALTSSHNAAATGAVAISFAGAAGVLAVALAL